ncbi:hypothetical protein SXCC_01432 [Gluconacetobacter sp. SXCC-1]|nr:hypothetical protein SXCC_01432 [Gluconacetobacter sp. SXCC-1]
MAAMAAGIVVCTRPACVQALRHAMHASRGKLAYFMLCLSGCIHGPAGMKPPGAIMHHMVT